MAEAVAEIDAAPPATPTPDPASALLLHAAALHRNGDLEGAARGYEAVLTLEPARVDALHLRGVVERHIGRPVRGVRLIGRALALHPDHPALRHNLGLASGQAVPLVVRAYQEQNFAELFELADALVFSGAVSDDGLRNDLAGMLNNAAYVLNERSESELGLRCIELAWRLVRNGAIFTLLPMSSN